MKILLLGANGQVGWELQRSLAPLGQVKVRDRHTANLEDVNGLRKLVRDYSPDVIVNAAALTTVDKAESEPEKTYRINAKAVGLLAKEAKQLDALLIHYSTDYVFDGTKTKAYTETDKTNPQCVYGKTKLEGEQAIKTSGCKHLIFRSSWVYAVRGDNFIKTIMRLTIEQDELQVVNDQIGAPTSAELIADVTALCLYKISQIKNQQKLTGTYNLTATGETSWHNFAQYITSEMQKQGEFLKINPDKIEPIKTVAATSTATRPSNSRLCTQKIKNSFNISLPPWQTHVVRMIKEIYTTN